MVGFRISAFSSTKWLPKIAVVMVTGKMSKIMEVQNNKKFHVASKHHIVPKSDAVLSPLMRDS